MTHETKVLTGAGLAECSSSHHSQRAREATTQQEDPANQNETKKQQQQITWHLKDICTSCGFHPSILTDNISKLFREFSKTFNENSVQ